MSKFLRKMERMSAKPEDFKPTKTETTVATLPTVVTVPTVAKVTTVPVRARNVQHAHTVWEQQLYEALWREASPAGQEYRELSMGYRHIAALTGLSLRTVQRNMKYLQQKFALEPVGRYDPDTKTPKTYRIYSYREILARRREAGKEWVIINRQGVELVGLSAKAETQDSPPSLTTVATVTTVVTQPTATVATVTTADSRHGDDSFREERKESSQPSSSGVSIVIERVRKHLAVDDDVIRMVIRQCRRNDPDCTHDEIAEFAAHSAAKISRQRNVGNPAGLLISQAPKFFPGSELQAYRARKARELAESREVARKILDDAESPAEAREWAQAVLEEGKG